MDQAAIRSDSVSESDNDVDNGADQRGAQRFTLLIRPAKLISDHGEFICVIRDVSSTGVSVRLFHALPGSGELALEFQGGDQYPVERRWDTNGEAGFEFSEDVEVEKFISEVGAFPKRGLRLGIQFPVTIHARGLSHEAIVENISQQGARICCEEPFAIDQGLRISGEALRDVRAKVRWRGDGTYGVVFDDTSNLADFARLAAELQCPNLLEA